MRSTKARRRPLFAAALGLTALGSWSVSSADAQPNILILVADDFGVELMAPFEVGTDPADTPSLNRLAAEGVRFTSAWSNPVCSTTRATIQTGLYSFRTGIGETNASFEVGLRLDSEFTLADLVSFADPPYTTAAFGKWHLNGEDADGGFGFDAPNEAGYDLFVGTMRNLAFDGIGNYYDYTRVRNGQAREIEDEYITTATADWFIEWVGQAQEPWLAYVAFHAPHSPFHVPPTDLHEEAECVEGFVDPRPCFRASISALDHEVGRVLEAIEGDGSTTVFFVGDNGTDGAVVGDPFEPDRAKGTLYEGGIRVPFLAWNPLLYAPRTVSALVHTADLYATVGELAGVDTSRVVLDSTSLVGYLEGVPPAEQRDFLFAELFTPNGCEPFTNYGAAARDDRYKLIRLPDSEGGGEALYDLSGLPPWETDDLLPDLTEDQQASYDELSAFLDSLNGQAGTACENGRECCSKLCISGVCQ